MAVRRRQPMLTAMKRLSEPPVSPLTRTPTLDRRWAAVILRCMARDPEARFASAGEVIRALEVPSVAPGRAMRYVLASAALLAAGLGLWLAPHSAHHEPAPRELQLAAPSFQVVPAVVAPTVVAPTVAPLPARPVKPHGDKHHSPEPTPKPKRWNGEIVDPEDAK